MWKLLSVITICLVGIGAVLMSRGSPDIAHTTSSTASLTETAASTQATSPTPGTPDVPSTYAKGPRVIPLGEKEYRTRRFHFSLLYPDALQVQEHVDAEGVLTVAFQGTDVSDLKGFQVYVQPYTLKEVTADRFQKDEPSGVRKNIQAVTIDGTTGVAFDGADATLGETDEVWFIHKGLLYEATSPKSLEAWFQNILQTWQFVE